jgi:translation initiation factor IF-2
MLKHDMSDSDENEKGDVRQAERPKTLSLTKTVEGGKVRQNFQRGRSKTVTVEVKKTRTFARQGTAGSMVEVNRQAQRRDGRFLTTEERETRLRALKEAGNSELTALPVRNRGREDDKVEEAETSNVLMPVDEMAARNLEIVRKDKDNNKKAAPAAATPGQQAAAAPSGISPAVKKARTEEEEADKKNKKIRLKESDNRRSARKLTVAQALGLDDERTRSLASLKRQRAKSHRHDTSSQEKIAREVVIPEMITVQELANRMAERGVDVIKSLMKMGTLATATQAIDADTAEIIVAEFGHKAKRVSEADVEDKLIREDDKSEDMRPRPPVVTVMGHVDHGKTSLLDALRKTDVVAGEAGGITQHIGAYQVELEGRGLITFLDTPGHEAFTAMRARGAKVTDIVILVVAADDGIMPQTIEAINHAKAAGVPIIVAINKIDKPGADPEKVKTALMQYELVPEDFGGDIMTVPVSALQGTGLDDLKEGILLQAEMADFKANPSREAAGSIVEAKVDKGRGTVATFLVQRGTLRVGDLVVAGMSYGKVRALYDDKGRPLTEALPSQPVEVLGLNEPPAAGDEFAVVDSERTARDITEYRIKKEKERVNLVSAKSLDQLFATSAGEAPKELPVIVKADVHGSAEAISGAIARFDGDEVKVKISHQAVGAINESDISLANATGAMVVGFNVRATPKAKELAEREGVKIRYYSIIYDLIDDIKQALSGMLSPDMRENLLGYAEIRDVFNITKVGKVAGCMVTDGMIKRGAKVRLLRDSVVIHEGTLKTLKRFKEEVKEVQKGYECGMAFENYEDVKVGDQIEAFEMQSFAREVTINTNNDKKAESA